MFLTMTANAHAAQLLWDCTTDSDPDNVNVSIYQSGQKQIAVVSQQSGDGDEYAEDLIEVVKSDNGNDSVVTFKQVEGAQPQGPKTS